MHLLINQISFNRIDKIQSKSYGAVMLSNDPSNETDSAVFNRMSTCI